MTISETVIYKEIGGAALAADLCLPTACGQASPVFFYLHGGGWLSGDRSEVRLSARLVDALLARGIAVISLDYRFCDGGRSFPVPLDDCADALRFFSANADRWRLNPHRFAVGGLSAGAHLSLMLAFAASRFGDLRTPIAPVRAVIDLSGPADLARLTYRETEAMERCLAAFLGEGPPFDPARMNEASPLTYLKRLPASAPLPPIFAVHGELDPLVDPKQPVWIAEEYARRGGSFWLLTVEHAGHVFEQVRNQPQPPMTYADIQAELAEFICGRI